MVIQRFSLRKVLAVYSRVYQVLAWLTLLFILVGSAGCAWEAKQGNREAVFSYLTSGGALVITDVRFFVWWKICRYGQSAIETKSKADLLLKISKLFLWSFSFDILKLAYQNVVPLERTDWDSVDFPQYSGNLILFLRETMSYFFKMTVVWDGFLTPTTFGLASLFLSLLCKYLAEKSESPVQV